MVKMSLPSVTLELTHSQIKLCLIAIDALINLINDATVQDALTQYIKRVEEHFELHLDSIPISDVSSWFSDDLIQKTNENLLLKYYELPILANLH